MREKKWSGSPWGWCSSTTKGQVRGKKGDAAPRKPQRKDYANYSDYIIADKAWEEEMKAFQNELSEIILRPSMRINKLLVSNEGTYIEQANFGDLAYESNDPAEITLTLKYDYAVLQF